MSLEKPRGLGSVGVSVAVRVFWLPLAREELCRGFIAKECSHTIESAADADVVTGTGQVPNHKRQEMEAGGNIVRCGTIARRITADIHCGDADQTSSKSIPKMFTNPGHSLAGTGDASSA